MASKKDFITPQAPYGTRSKRRYEQEEAAIGNASPVRKRNQPKTSSSHAYRKPVRLSNRSAPFRRQKLYTQTSFVGPTGFEPFSTFKRSVTVDDEPDEESFPTATCRAIGCWQFEPHFHDFSELSQKDVHGVHFPDPLNCGKEYGIKDSDTRASQSEVGQRVRKPPSPLVAGPASTSERIVKSSPFRPQQKRCTETPKTSHSSTFQSHSNTFARVSPMDPNRNGIRDLRKALPKPSSTSKTAGWQGNLPFHTRPLPTGSRRDEFLVGRSHP